MTYNVFGGTLNLTQSINPGFLITLSLNGMVFPGDLPE